MGAALAGSKEFIQEAWRWKHQFGGAMRQAGIIAAGALYALDHHVDRLAEDHENARILAEGLAEVNGIEVEPVETNLRPSYHGRGFQCLVDAERCPGFHPW